MSQASEQKQIKYQNITKVFQASVETVRKVLKCDRVIIYDANSLPQAKVLAESVVQKEMALLGQTIDDPFLAGEYLAMYCYGMSITIDDIHSSDVHKKYLHDLEKLGIKSVAVAPIYVEKQLVTFLVAHQCSLKQPWDLTVVDFLAEQAGTISIALSAIIQGDESNNSNLAQQISEIYCHQPTDNLQPKTGLAVDSTLTKKFNQQETLIQKTRERLFNQIKNQIILGQAAENVDVEKIFQTTVVKTRQLIECDRVLIFSLDKTELGEVIAESVAAGWAKTMDSSKDNFSPTTRYFEEDRHGKVRVWHNSEDEDASSWYRKQLEAFNVRAGIVAPLAYENKLFGLLIAHQCSNRRSWQEQEINWITQIANHLGTMLEQTRNANNQQANQPQLADIQQQLQRERMWTRYFANIVQAIRKSLKTEDILKTTVEQVHPILKCDRALVYALNQDSYGEIVAESVSSGWTKAIGKVIKDPCFEARYLAKYRDGRFRAWNNIYKSGMTDCYIEQLERLEVQASIVVPLINEDKLFGLLVVQQCSGTRQWQQSEILWLTQIATQVGFALDNAQLLADAQRLRQQAEQEKMWSAYFTDAVQQIRNSLKTKDVYQASVREVRRVINCDRVVVYSLNQDNQDNYGMIVAESVAHSWTKGEGRIIKDPCFEARYLEKYRDGRVRAWHDIYQGGMTSCYIEQLEQLEVKANLVVPIVSEGKLFGLLVAHQCSGTRQWQQPEIEWMTQIAIQVSFALENAQMLEQIEQRTKATQEILNRAVVSSANIQRTVQNVTQGLENLSNSGDRFSETVEMIKDLSKQLAQQSMDMIRAANQGQKNGSEPKSTVDMSDKIFSLMQELFEATAKIDPLFNSIKTEITGKTTNLESETETLLRGVDDFQTASQKLEQIIALNQEISNLIKTTTDALETQIQGSTFAQDSVQELTNITERISQQSITMIESFKQLGRIIA